jgi:hypothetical protein
MPVEVRLGRIFLYGSCYLAFTSTNAVFPSLNAPPWGERLSLGEYDGLPHRGKLPHGGGWNSPVGGEYNAVMNKFGMSYCTGQAWNVLWDKFRFQNCVKNFDFVFRFRFRIRIRFRLPNSISNSISFFDFDFVFDFDFDFDFRFRIRFSIFDSDFTFATCFEDWGGDSLVRGGVMTSGID